ncbi:MAG: lipopolysaccharide biosynthesis protein [Bacteroidaceae bacterium]|nr:lipopolysaccharide biosynthesis protein [Bacteroidaceae bacterium]
MSESLKDKTVKGVGWSAVDNVAGYAVTFVVGIILARLLSPADYGLLGLIGIFTTICGCFINAGFGSALIRKKDVTDDDYNTVFIFNLGMSILLYGVMFICAPLIAKFFERQELIALTRVSSLGLIIGALAMVQRTRLTKQIDFKTQTKITIISSIVRGIVGITTAFIGWGVWALVAQELVGNITSTCLLWFYNKWFPRISFSMTSFHELFGYGSKMLVSNIIDTTWGQTYQMVIGKCYAPAVLGQYTRATMFSNILSSNVTGVVQRVSFPVLSQIQDDRTRLKDGYRRIIRSTMLITFASMLMLAAVSKPMILVLIGEKWLQSATFLQIICFSGMLYPLHAINLNMLQVQGRSDLFLKLEIIKKIIAIGPLLLGIFVSIYWMLIGSVFIGFISYYLNAYYSGPLLNYSIRNQIKDIMPSFFLALIPALIAFIPVLIYDVVWNGENWIQVAKFIFPLQLILGITFFIVLNEKIKTSEYLEVKGIIVPALRKIISKIRKN